MATSSEVFAAHSGLFVTMQPVVVPNIVGKSRPSAEKTLSNATLRYVATFPFSATGDGSATHQQPAAGTTVRPYSVVTVAYPSPQGPLPDAPEQGAILSGWVTGDIERVTVDPHGARVTLAVSQTISFEFGLYTEAGGAAREVWMRRGAMLALAQRALTGKNRVQIEVADWFARSISILA